MNPIERKKLPQTPPEGARPAARGEPLLVTGIEILEELFSKRPGRERGRDPAKELGRHQRTLNSPRRETERHIFSSAP